MNPIDILNKSVLKLSQIKNFDLVSFAFNFKRMVDSIYFFNNNIGANCRNSKEITKIQYSIKPRPKVGQIAYFYIENSYPKEIYNSHWCLILKDFGSTMTIVPLTSLKDDSSTVDLHREFLVTIKDFCQEGQSRVRVNQIFSADALRIDKSRGYYELEDDFDEVKNKILKIFSETLDNSKPTCYN